MSNAPFYRSTATANVFAPTVSTRGPWSNDHQHAGPPSALLARAVEQLAPSLTLARVTCEMRKPIAIAPVTVHAAIEKAGKKTAIVTATLHVHSEVVLAMRALLVRTLDTPRVEHEGRMARSGAAYAFNFFQSDVGYHTAIELLHTGGTWGSGKMSCWMRQRVPLVDDERASGAQRVLVLADAASGVSAALDTKTHSFVNADLSVHFARALQGEWLFMEATTSSAGNGAALAASRMRDELGLVAHSLQSLVVEPLAAVRDRAPVVDGEVG